MPEFNPLICERCGRDLESDDAISVIEGVCAPCRGAAGALVQPSRADEMLAPDACEPLPPADPRPASLDATSLPSRVVESHPAAPQAPGTAGATETPTDRPGFRPPPPPFKPAPPHRGHRRKRDLTIGITGGLLLTLAATAFFLRGRPAGDGIAVPADAPPARLILRVSPPDARVTIDGEPAGRLDAAGRLSLAMPAGALDDRWLEITAPGYFPVRQPLGLYRGAPEALIELVHRPYELSVVTDPPGAEILIDNRPRGLSPLTLTLDSPRGGTLAARRPGYLPYARTFAPPSDGRPLELNLTLERAGVALAIESDPPHAEIRLDGRPRGRAPLNLELDPGWLGRTIELVASAPGYEDARLETTLPEIGGPGRIPARLVLSRARSTIEVRTDPPGGRVVVAGRDFGPAPVRVEFEAGQTGRPMVVEASLGGTHFGRRAVTIPPAGQPASLTIPLVFSAQRVVFVLASPDCAAADHQRLIDRLTAQIHALLPSQRFALLAATDDGTQIWPADHSLAAASSEQKVRAYDQVRAVRPTGLIDLAELLQAARTLTPTTVWMFLGGDLDRKGIERFDASGNVPVFAINVVRAASAPDDEWLDAWTARHHGLLTLLDRESFAALALDEDQ